MSFDDRLPFQRRNLSADLGSRLRAARGVRRASRVEVAAAVGIAARTLARIERGAQKPTWPTLDRLCDELGLSVSAIARRWTADSVGVPESAVEALGVGLRAVRRARGVTLERLADLSGISAATLSRHERGLIASRLLDEPVGGSLGPGREDGYGPLAAALGFDDAASLRAACLVAAP